MEKLKKILEAEIAQRNLAMKHNPLNKAEIAAELDELNQGLVKLFDIPDVVKPKGTVCEHTNTFYDDRNLGMVCNKCRCVIPD